MDYISKNYEKRHLYSGIHGYHAHHGRPMNRPKNYGTSKYRIGVELEVEFHNLAAARRFKEAKSNWFYLERDGSIGGDDSEGIEIITVPMKPSDAKAWTFWAEELTQFIAEDANSWDTNGRCGLHVHIGNERLGGCPQAVEETRAKLIYLHEHFLKYHPIIKRVYGRDRSYHEANGQTPAGDSAAALSGTRTLMKTRKLQEDTKREIIDRNTWTRYHAINILNDHTTEFRLGKGSLNPQRIAAVVEWCDLQCQYARRINWGQISTEDFFDFLKFSATDNLRTYIGEWVSER